MQAYREASGPRFGEIWMCHLNQDGSVQGGYRPVFIASNNLNNTHSTTLNVIPITSKMNKRKLPVHVELWDPNKFGLKEPSTMMVEQFTTIPASRLDRCVGKIDDTATIGEIRDAMTVQFPIFQMSTGEKLQA